MKLTEHKLESLSSLSYSIFTCPLITWDYMECLVVAFKGECGHGSGSNGDAAFMTAIIKAAAAVWRPAGCLLDLRQMKYEWGDEMLRPICAFDPCHVGDKLVDFPMAVVVSNLNRRGFTSLVRQEMDGDPGELLFDSIEAALAAVDKQAQRIYPAK